MSLQDGKSFLIAIEGIDGAGKSDFTQECSRFLSSRGIPNRTTFEPTKGRYGSQITGASERLSPKEERRWFLLDRADHFSLEVAPNLALGLSVITDRYFYSSIAYQGTRVDAILERGLDTSSSLQDEVRLENLSLFPEADVLIVLDVDPKTALARISKARGFMSPFEESASLSRVRGSFILQASKHTNGYVIDTTRGRGWVSQQIEDIFTEVFGLEVL